MTDTTSTETSTPVAPMRLRAEPPRVTRLSRKVLASVAAVALVGIGGALVYATCSLLPAEGEDQTADEKRGKKCGRNGAGPEFSSDGEA